MKKYMSKEKLLTYAYNGCLAHWDDIAIAFANELKVNGKVSDRVQAEFDQCLADADELQDRLDREVEKRKGYAE